MTNCRELGFDDLIAVTAIPITDFNVGTAAWQLTPTIPATAFSPSYATAVTIGRQPVTPAAIVIPIIRQTGKVNDDENDSVAGRLHTVTVACEVDERDNAVWDNLLALERTPCHLLLRFRDHSNAFVAASIDTYLCTVNRDGGKTAVTFKVKNVMGIQPIV